MINYLRINQMEYKKEYRTGTDFENESLHILKVLYDTHYNPFHDESIPTSLSLLSRFIGLDEKRTKDLCDSLKEKHYINEIKVGHLIYYKINHIGIEYIETANV